VVKSSQLQQDYPQLENSSSTARRWVANLCRFHSFFGSWSTLSYEILFSSWACFWIVSLLFLIFWFQFWMFGKLKEKASSNASDFWFEFIPFQWGWTGTFFAIIGEALTKRTTEHCSLEELTNYLTSKAISLKNSLIESTPTLAAASKVTKLLSTLLIQWQVHQSLSQQSLQRLGWLDKWFDDLFNACVGVCQGTFQQPRWSDGRIVDNVVDTP
jgi:hypothetical protein